MPSRTDFSADVMPARYGYWIDRNGAILRVDDTHGHVPVLFDIGEFQTMSPCQPYHEWYEAALSRGWIRVIAAAQDRMQFRFQFTVPTSMARCSLIGLLGGLPRYEQYIFESSSYQVFSSAQEATAFVQDSAIPGSDLGRETWTDRK